MFRNKKSPREASARTPRLHGGVEEGVLISALLWERFGFYLSRMFAVPNACLCNIPAEGTDHTISDSIYASDLIVPGLGPLT